MGALEEGCEVSNVRALEGVGIEFDSAGIVKRKFCQMEKSLPEETLLNIVSSMRTERESVVKEGLGEVSEVEALKPVRIADDF
ncbi:hypothetical protein [Halostella pelagica]|uniref:hypothetical protein n=1 Tax=Halostella pelagica TaxID=2583824 RepID=UPI001F26E20B|nr:hypothetical protein [Halostella pelagica]